MGVERETHAHRWTESHSTTVDHVDVNSASRPPRTVARLVRLKNVIRPGATGFLTYALWY